MEVTAAPPLGFSKVWMRQHIMHIKYLAQCMEHSIQWIPDNINYWNLFSKIQEEEENATDSSRAKYKLWPQEQEPGRMC